MSAGPRTVVVKIGGAAVAAGGGVPPVIAEIVELWQAGHRVVVVHGGGPEISEWSRRVGLAPRFVDGLRHSDPDTVAVAEMALARVGKGLAGQLTAAGARAVSLGGRDAGLLQAEPLRRLDPAGQPVDLGLVGTVTAVRTEVLADLHRAGFLPVVASVAAAGDGTPLNVNADDAAAEIAAACGAECLCLVTDVPGLLVPGEDAPLARCSADQAQRLIAAGIVTGGMRPKVEACLRAVGSGAGAAWIVDGRCAGALGRAIAGAPGAGTLFPGPAAAAAAVTRPEDGDALAADRAYVMQTYTRAPVVLARGVGSTVWDLAGRPYLDFLCGISVTNLGHCHPRVVEAIVRQAQALGHTSNLYHTLPQLELAQALCQAAFPGRVFFCNSGAEATEGALKLCRKAAWRKAQAGQHPPALEIVSFEHAFHGRTYGALAVTRGYQEGFGPMLPAFRELPWDDPAAAEQAIGPNTAGVIVEPIQGEAGIRPASTAFLRRLRELCDRFDACLIFDEVQCGLGRAGTLFAFEQFGVRPDVLTLGKALGGGLPMGAILAAEDWASALRPGDHGSTFGGNPIVAAAALAGLRVLQEEGLAEQGRLAGERLRRLLRTGLADCAWVREVRGVGLMTGIELQGDPDLGARLVAACRERGVLLNCTAGRVLRLMPPLTISPADLQRGAERVVEAVRAEGARSRPQPA